MELIMLEKVGRNSKKQFRSLSIVPLEDVEAQKGQ